MNKKGFDVKYLVGIVIALVMLGLILGMTLKGIANPSKKLVTCEEQYCVAKTDGCAAGKRENVNKECKESTMMCCMSPEEMIGIKKPGSSTPNTQETPNFPNVVPQTGNLYIKLGESDVTSLAGSSKQLKIGNTYDFKIYVDGSLDNCIIKVLNTDTLTAVQEPWIKGTGDLSCKTTQTLTLTPNIAQLSKQYRLEVSAYNSSHANVKSAVVNLVVVS